MQRIAARGFHPKVIAPSTASPHKAGGYFDEMLAVPGVSGLVSTLSYHRYSPIPARLSLPTILERAREHGLQTAMLEHVLGDANELHEDLTLADVSAWSQYQIAGNAPTGGAKLVAPYYVMYPDA